MFLMILMVSPLYSKFQFHILHIMQDCIFILECTPRLHIIQVNSLHAFSYHGKSHQVFQSCYLHMFIFFIKFCCILFLASFHPHNFIKYSSFIKFFFYLLFLTKILRFPMLIKCLMPRLGFCIVTLTHISCIS